MINTDTLALDVKTFAQSSAFTSGDPFSFSVKITDDISLPGKFEPSKYLNTITSAIDGRVAVVCPGNGGLCVELLRRGGLEVIAFEPRNQFWKSLDAVAEFYKSVNGKTFDIIDKLPVEDSGKFNTVIWSEGLDELRDPLGPLTEILGCLVPQGRMFIELAHGSHKASPEAINSWRPSPEAFAETIEAIENAVIVDKAPGRNDSRATYTIQNTEDEPILIISEPEAENQDEPATAFANDAASDDNKVPEAPVKKKRRGRPRKTESSKAAPKRRGRKRKE